QQRQHNLPSFGAFLVDLAKAYNTANHDLLIKNLEQYWAPPKLCSAIKIMNQNLKLDSTAQNWKREGKNTSKCWSKTRRQPIASILF
ncbi:hypothetical protein ACHAXR_001961, partial [Thalassiosira sp. AJA248-18]